MLGTTLFCNKHYSGKCLYFAFGNIKMSSCYLRFIFSYFGCSSTNFFLWSTDPLMMVSANIYSGDQYWREYGYDFCFPDSAQTTECLATECPMRLSAKWRSAHCDQLPRALIAQWSSSSLSISKKGVDCGIIVPRN
jgi:hypothetical protein